MVSPSRKPFQGVINIILFNWPFYAAVLVLPVAVLCLRGIVTGNTATLMVLLTAATLLAAFVSLVVSCYVYDLSGLYRFRWMAGLPARAGDRIWNINAGFDETSVIIRHQFPGAELQVFDFYDPARHTEPSIRRARKKYPPYPGTIACNTTNLPEGNRPSLVFLIFAAHEIRDRDERIGFLRTLGRAIAPGGRIVLVEHQRDLPNFLAYTIGFFHFYSRAEWQRCFRAAGLRSGQVSHLNPFVTKFELYADGVTS
ncbi:MAG: methyltransferase [Chitinophagaceae bacterium]|nr:MAG: methyltransferase [Chitinophagaceae bacterium]